MHSLFFIWNRLTNPAASITIPEHRRNSQLLASLLVVLIPAGILSVLIQLLTIPEFGSTFLVVISGIVFLFVAYRLSRTRNYLWGAAITASMPTVVVFVNLFVNPADKISFAYLIVGILIGSMLLPKYTTIILVGIDISGIVFLSLLSPDFALVNLIDVMSLIIIISALILLSVYHRNLIEQDRQSTLVTTNQSLQQEIAERIRAEAEWHKLFWVVEQSPVSIIITDVDANIEYINPKFTQVTGYTLEEVLGKKPSILQSEETPAEEFERLWNTITAGHEFRGEFRNKKKNGELYWESVTISAIRNTEGNISHFLAMQQDITEHKSIEAQVQQQARLAAVGQLAAGIAHDFNNLLTPIHLYTEMTIADLPEGSRARSNLEQVFRAADRAKDLVQQILAFSRKETGLDRQPVQILPIINDVFKLLRASLPATINISQNINTEKGIVMANPTQIHQVIMNLCTNAYQAMGEHGGVLSINLDVVDIATDFSLQHPNLEAGTFVKVTISDTGHGMDQVTMDRIFDPFFTTKTVGEGTGMGLSVVYGIVMSHGGDIIVTSNPGKGTTFSVYLPQLDKAVAVDSQREKFIPRGTESILLVDDEEEVVVAVKHSLEHLGYDVTMMTSGILALEMFRSQPDSFDLIITDQTMPNMTGVQLAQEMMHIRPNLPIILITGFSETITPEHASEMGFRQYLMKPLIAHDLGRIIREVLDEEK